MTVRELLDASRAEILEIAARHGARNVRLFGSVLRGTDGPDSDVDVLVTLDPDRSLLDHVALQQDLEELLGRRVHVLVEGGISPHLEDRIRAEATPL